MSLAPEGRPFVALGGATLGLLVVAGAVLKGWWWAPAVVWLPIALWIPWFFRDPQRSGPRDPRVLLAPADGRVVAVGRVSEPEFVGGDATRVSIFMSVFNVHVNRYPTDGVVRHRAYRPGVFVNASLDKASEANERMSIGVETPRGPILIRQIAGLVARRIVADHDVGAPVRQGARMGMIRFGSRVDTIVPLGARIAVEPGHRTIAGVTVIGEWP